MKKFGEEKQEADRVPDCGRNQQQNQEWQKQHNEK